MIPLSCSRPDTNTAPTRLASATTAKKIVSARRRRRASTTAPTTAIATTASPTSRPVMMRYDSVRCGASGSARTPFGADAPVRKSFWRKRSTSRPRLVARPQLTAGAAAARTITNASRATPTAATTAATARHLARRDAARSERDVRGQADGHDRGELPRRAETEPEHHRRRDKTARPAAALPRHDEHLGRGHERGPQRVVLREPRVEPERDARRHRQRAERRRHPARAELAGEHEDQPDRDRRAHDAEEVDPKRQAPDRHHRGEHAPEHHVGGIARRVQHAERADPAHRFRRVAERHVRREGRAEQPERDRGHGERPHGVGAVSGGGAAAADGAGRRPPWPWGRPWPFG